MQIVVNIRLYGAWISFPPPPLFSKFSYKSFLFQNFHNHSFFLHLTISVDVIHHEQYMYSVSTFFEKIKINFVVNRRYSIFNMFAESNYFVNFCLNVLPPPSTLSIFCECAEHKNSEFYSFYVLSKLFCDR
jgi:hypothetical protein